MDGRPYSVGTPIVVGSCRGQALVWVVVGRLLHGLPSGVRSHRCSVARSADGRSASWTRVHGGFCTGAALVSSMFGAVAVLGLSAAIVRHVTGLHHVCSPGGGGWLWISTRPADYLPARHRGHCRRLHRPVARSPTAASTSCSLELPRASRVAGHRSLWARCPRMLRPCGRLLLLQPNFRLRPGGTSTTTLIGRSSPTSRSRDYLASRAFASNGSSLASCRSRMKSRLSCRSPPRAGVPSAAVATARRPDARRAHAAAADGARDDVERQVAWPSCCRPTTRPAACRGCIDGVRGRRGRRRDRRRQQQRPSGHDGRRSRTTGAREVYEITAGLRRGDPARARARPTGSTSSACASRTARSIPPTC